MYVFIYIFHGIIRDFYATICTKPEYYKISYEGCEKTEAEIIRKAQILM